MNSIRRPQRGRSGFSLLEMLVSIGILALLMTTLAFHTFSLTQIWRDDTDHDFFQQHAEGVALFLNASLLRAAPAATGAGGGAAAAAGGGTVEWARPPDWGETRDPLLFFRLTEAPPLFVMEGVRLPDVNCYIHFESGEGLSIIWFSDLQEEAETLNDLFRTPLSRLVDRIEYAYYDRESDRWSVYDRPETEPDGSFLLPDFLRLHFSHEGETTTRNVFIPQNARDVPVF